MAEEYGIKLPLQKAVCPDKAVRLGGHEKGDSLNRSGSQPVRFHDFPVGSETRRPLCRIPDIQMVAVAFAGDRGVGAENNLRLKIADRFQHSMKQFFRVVESTV